MENYSVFALSDYICSSYHWASRERDVMNQKSCTCGLPNRRPEDEFCIKCGNLIPNNRLSFAEVIDFPPNFTQDVCKCSDTIRKNWGERQVNEFNICTYCLKFSAGRVEETLEDELFSDLDIPLILDSTKPQYKVITQKDRFFSTKFNPALIERALNEYAQDGWILKEAVTADFAALGGSRNELIIFMEKKPNV